MKTGDELIQELKASREELRRQADGLPPFALRQRSNEEEWSIIEVLAHLIDVDNHWLDEALAIRDDSDHTFVGFDDDRWKREHPTVRQEAINDTERQLTLSHERVIQTLSLMTDDELERQGKHPRGIPYAVKEVFLRYPGHDRNHTEQIKSIKEHINL
jgi:uncharacterized damage-inducible protein DinB